MKTKAVQIFGDRIGKALEQKRNDKGKYNNYWIEISLKTNHFHTDPTKQRLQVVAFDTSHGNNPTSGEFPNHTN